MTTAVAVNDEDGDDGKRQGRQQPIASVLFLVLLA